MQLPNILFYSVILLNILLFCCWIFVFCRTWEILFRSDPTVATYCPSKPGKLPKFVSSKPCEWRDAQQCTAARRGEETGFTRSRPGTKFTLCAIKLIRLLPLRPIPCMHTSSRCKEDKLLPGLGIPVWGLVTSPFKSCVSQLSVNQISRHFVYF